MINNKTVTAIILSAGNSTRFGQGINKNFAQIHGKQVILYSIEAFNENKYIDDIIIATKKDETNIVEQIISKAKVHKKITLVIGGDTRKESVYNSIRNTNSEIVIIHDSARPMIKQEYIDKCLIEMNEFKGVSIGVKSKDTIKITNKEGIVEQSTIRENTWIVQTPQCFERTILLENHEKVKDDSTITDDCMILEKFGHKVKMIEGDYSNIKITTYDDLDVATAYVTKS